jgi:phytoene dehydrogenase-like protein
MTPGSAYDAVIVGSGPNGLAAAITLAEAGRSTLVVERNPEVGGGTRSAELTLPGFVHDMCAAILPLTVASPFFRRLPLERYGVEFITPPAALAHPLDDGPAVLLEGGVEETASYLDGDGRAYWKLMAPLVEDWEQLIEEFLGPFPFPPRHPILASRFALSAIWPAYHLARSTFQGERARALFGGLAGHAIQPLESPATASFALMEGVVGHALGWPLLRGGTQGLSRAMAAHLQSLGGEIRTDTPVQSLDELPAARVYLLDVTPRQVLQIAGKRLPESYSWQLSGYRYGPGVFKLDFALSGPIPWKDPACARAATLHLGGTLEEIAASERAVWKGEHPERPFIIMAQQSLFDASRAPQGQHTAWAYCHVPNGSTVDMTCQIENQIERFAPGFRDLVLACHVTTPAQLEAYNPNYIGGDINGGAQDLRQFFTRPVARIVPYSTPADDIYICSSSTPPGGGVHGMCGYQAARAALKTVLRE